MNVAMDGNWSLENLLSSLLLLFLAVISGCDCRLKITPEYSSLFRSSC